MSHPASKDRQPGAGRSLAGLFEREKDPAAFRRAVLELGGDFPFTTADMIALGKAYLERYPDRDRDRNAGEVRLGYAIVRLAIVEKAVLAIAPHRRSAYRSIFHDVDRIRQEVESLVAAAGREAILADHDSLAAALAVLQEAIEGIPKGMIKERFIGGISYFFNVLYALKMSLGGRGPG